MYHIYKYIYVIDFYNAQTELHGNNMLATGRHAARSVARRRHAGCCDEDVERCLPLVANMLLTNICGFGVTLAEFILASIYK